ncbi:hypothetical protein AUI46_04245 [archaeon 13_1_40CM_2_52_13]|nr:MAG: hypothetical protein AUI46_04245 [archaeon 13_1_40CM_2_52_13]OLE69363.1 MAG: hypothetical protein AUF78_11450 [archaeon 13_1_20CM_2_51_12]
MTQHVFKIGKTRLDLFARILRQRPFEAAAGTAKLAHPIDLVSSANGGIHHSGHLSHSLGSLTIASCESLGSAIDRRASILPGFAFL